MSMEMVKTESLELPTPEKENKNESHPLFDYLTSQSGHEIASGLLQIVDGVKRSTIDANNRQVRIEKIIQLLVILAVIVSTSFLVFFDKFEASVGVLFGTLVGYVFGKNK